MRVVVREGRHASVCWRPGSPALKMLSSWLRGKFDFCVRCRLRIDVALPPPLMACTYFHAARGAVLFEAVA